MTQLTVWVFDDPRRVRRAVREVADLAAHDRLRVHDGASVAWPQGAAMPRARQEGALGGPGALGTSFWHLLFGLAFLVPLMSEVADSSSDPLWGSLVDAGIDQEFLQQVRARVVLGTSALFVLGEDAVARALAGPWAAECDDPVVATIPSRLQRALREVFPPDA